MTNDDLIKRSDAIKAIEELPNAYNGWSDAYDKAYIIGTLEEVPKADRPSGEWIIEKTLYGNYNYRCNNCDWYETHAYPDCEPYNFCPHCGARMRGADDETN